MKEHSSGRFAPGVQVDGALVRERLLAELLGGAPRTARLMLVCAPAGFGKTTLLAQAERLLAGRGEPTFWLNCADGDSEPGAFLDALAQGLRHGGLEVAAEGGLEALLAALDAGPRRGCLFLDQVERLQGAEVERLLERLAHGLPGNMRLLLGSRARPAFAQVQLELAGKLKVVRADGLRCTEVEARQLLGGVFDEECTRHWTHYTQGWPFALRLLRLHGGRHAHGTVFDYLARELFASWPPELREFLLDACVLDSLEVASLNHLREHDDTERALRAAERLVPMTVQEKPLRAHLHPLLREFLLGRLESREPLRFAQLQARAAVYHAANGQIVRAIEHAARGRHHALAAELVLEAGALRLLVSEGAGRTRELLDLLPPPEVRRHPRLRLMLAYLHMIGGEALPGSLDLSRLEVELQDSACAEARTDLFYGRAMLLACGGWRASEDEVRERVEAAMADARLRYFEDPRYLCLALPGAILQLLRYGDIDEARLRLEELLQINRSEGFHENLPWTRLYRALADSVEARFGEVLETVGGLLDGDGASARPGIFDQLLHALLGHARYARGELGLAREAFARCLPKIGPPLAEVMARGVIGAARAAFFEGDIDEALAGLEALRRGRGREMPLRRAGLATLVELRCRLGEVEAALALALEIDLAPRWAQLREGAPVIWAELLAVAQAHYWLLVSQGQPAAAREVAEALERMARERLNQTGVGRALTLKAHALLVGELPGDPDAALDEALALLSAGGSLQCFIEAGALVVTRLREMARRPGREPSALIPRCIEQWERHFRARLDAQALFTRRELDALVSLAGGRTTKAIARELGISPETVKQHLKAVYAKLGVHRRKEALAAARSRAILP
ncbi:LuxR C-terminal-related transcriptional regulator [Pseudomonas citronellolis]|uniref:LuxR C-terminal-related transcriptional regulator n=1 Tax=Pseudomonas citronellolis TaxID=53408 RepID=UPI0023E4330C|nr:LuxR C-terminal-related transcriptional regulator [Pseudomonas citronellolis]MDF3934536.1 LuxR C-terminal-related transcriptional regulator [Pseudomonas citronellolis]